MSARRARALIGWLPAGSALHRSTEPEAWAWSSTDELLALNAELLDSIRAVLIVSNSKAGTKPPKPIRIDRPGRPARRGTTLDQLHSMVTRRKAAKRNDD